MHTGEDIIYLPYQNKTTYTLILYVIFHSCKEQWASMPYRRFRGPSVSSNTVTCKQQDM